MGSRCDVQRAWSRSAFAEVKTATITAGTPERLVGCVGCFGLRCFRLNGTDVKKTSEMLACGSHQAQVDVDSHIAWFEPLCSGILLARHLGARSDCVAWELSIDTLERPSYRNR